MRTISGRRRGCRACRRGSAASPAKRGGRGRTAPCPPATAAAPGRRSWRSRPRPAILAGARNGGQRAAADEAELAALEHHAAIAGREAARGGAVGDDVADRELALRGSRSSIRNRWRRRGIRARGCRDRSCAAWRRSRPGSHRGSTRLVERLRLASASASGASGSVDSSVGSSALARLRTGSAFDPSAISGSAAGLTWAGATDDAVSAAITKKAERSGTNMKTVTWAVNRPRWRCCPKAALAEGDSPTAWHLIRPDIADMRMPPALLLRP